MMSQRIVDRHCILQLNIIEQRCVPFFWIIRFMQIYSISIRILVEQLIDFLFYVFSFCLALHVAVQYGHLEVARSLLAESDIDVLTLNAK